MQEKKLQPLRVPFKKSSNETKTMAFEVQKGQKQIVQQPQRRLPQLNKANQPKSSLDAPVQENIEFLGKVTPQSVGLQILKDGYVESYVDFFYITNNCMKDFLQNSNFGFSINSRLDNFYDATEDNLNSLSSRLIKAEESTRYPDKTQAFEEYLKISEMFEQLGDFLVAAYFYKKVITISKLIKDFPYLAKAKLGLARCYDRVGQTEIAIKNFEENYQFCLKEGLEQTALMISRELIELYHKIASSYESEEHQDIPLAIEYYDKCLTVSEKVGEVEAKGSICHKMGLLYQKMSEYEKSIEYQVQYLEISSLQNNPKAKRQQMEAHSQIAKAQMIIDRIDDAQSHLESYYSLAKELRIYNAQSDSALHLATLFQKKNLIPKSLDFYQQHFNCAREEKPENGKDRNLIDRARVIYGIAKANANYSNFIKILENFVKILKESDKNLKPLLDWKLKKE